MNWHPKIAIGVVGGLLLLAGATSQSPAEPRMASLVQAGKVRVGLFLPQYAKDPASGELRGVGAHTVSLEVVRVLATRLKISAQFIGYRTPPEVVGCLKTGGCDLGIMGVDPARAAEVSLSPAFMQFDFTHLVPAGSSIRKVADADRPGVRIAVVSNHASTVALARMSKHAKFMEHATPDGAFKLLQSGQADIFASARPTLLDYVPRLAGSRVLDDAYGINRVALAIPRGQDAQMTYIREFLADMKRSGQLKRAIDNAGLRGFDVAP